VSSGERLLAVAGLVFSVAALITGVAGATTAAAVFGLLGPLLMLWVGCQLTRRA
jgi:hypothetical protein